MVTILAVTILAVWLAYSPDQWKTKLLAGLDFLNNKPNLIYNYSQLSRSNTARGS